jgi:hypothetical protein
MSTSKGARRGRKLLLTAGLLGIVVLEVLEFPIAIAVIVLMLHGCGGGAFDRPTTPAAPGYVELHRVTYDAFGQIDGVSTDSTAGPILRLWDAPGRQANLVAAVLSTYYYPIPTSQGVSQTTWAGSPRAAFEGSWLGAMAPGDSITLPVMGYFGDLPDSVWTWAAGYATARWARVGNVDVAFVKSVAIVHKGAAAETLQTFYTLGRMRTGFEVTP